MDSQLTRRKTPEEVELERKLEELSDLTELLAERELELATLRRAFSAFEAEYLAIVGCRYAELDELVAEIAELELRSQPDDAGLKTEAEEARHRAKESAASARGIDHGEPGLREPPSDELKNLYRSAAKAVHPDLATDEKGRNRRQEMMTEVNAAYERGDAQRIKEILEDWENAPEAVTGNDVGSRLVRAIREIQQVNSRLQQIDSEIDAMNSSSLAEIMGKRDAAAEEGRDLISELEKTVIGQIEKARTRLESLRARM